MSSVCSTPAAAVCTKARRPAPSHLALVLAATLFTACSGGMGFACGFGNDAAAPPASASSSSSPALATIDHVMPPRDSTGATPPRFEWTPVAGAESYTIAVENDIGVIVWRADRVRAASLAYPGKEPMAAGTYFWRVIAMRGEEKLAESGRAAFIVR